MRTRHIGGGRRWTRRLALVAALCGSACATYETQFTENASTWPGNRERITPQVYSGTLANAIFAKDIVTGNTGMDPAGQAIEAMLGVPLVLIDLPLSFAGDTMLLPYTIPRQARKGSIGAEPP